MPYVSEYMRGKEYNGDFFCGAVNSVGNVDILKYDTKQNKWSVWEKNFINGLIYYGFDIMDGKIYVTVFTQPNICCLAVQEHDISQIPFTVFLTRI